MRHKIFITACMASALALTACSDWDDHYDSLSADSGTMSLYEALLADSETSTFAELARLAGYDEVLDASQTYTVFAPVNDALTGFDSSNEDSLSRLMKNHIARYLQSSSTSSSESVRMLNDKNYYFDSSSSFSGSAIVKADQRATNGIIHQVQSRIPFAYNIYEMMANDPSTSKVYEFIHQFDEETMDEENSVEVNIDDDGRPVYDTIMISYNRLLEHELYGIGSIASEDSVYTMLIPDNTAWEAAYERISPSFVVYNADEQAADSIQDIRTKLAIVNDLVFRGPYSAPAAEDSLTTTTGSVIHDTANLFASADQTKASNGYAFVVSDLRYDNTETWDKPISVEAEEQNGRTYNNTTTALYTRTLSSESLIEDISGDSYIEVQPLTTSTNPAVVFEIPNVLAGTYNIYAEFLPSTVTGSAAELDSTKVSFTLTYLNERGRTSNKSARTSDMITSSTEKTKMLVLEEFEFPVSDYTDNLWLMDDDNDESEVETTTTLTVSTNVTTSEYTRGTYSRTFRLDRIILEPTEK